MPLPKTRFSKSRAEREIEQARKIVCTHLGDIDLKLVYRVATEAGLPFDVMFEDATCFYIVCNNSHHGWSLIFGPKETEKTYAQKGKRKECVSRRYVNWDGIIDLENSGYRVRLSSVDPWECPPRFDY